MFTLTASSPSFVVRSLRPFIVPIDDFVSPIEELCISLGIEVTGAFFFFFLSPKSNYFINANIWLVRDANRKNNSNVIRNWSWKLKTHLQQNNETPKKLQKLHRITMLTLRTSKFVGGGCVDDSDSSFCGFCSSDIGGFWISLTFTSDIPKLYSVFPLLIVKSIFRSNRGVFPKHLLYIYHVSWKKNNITMSCSEITIVFTRKVN